MYNQKINNSVFRNQHCVFFLAISVITLLLSLTFAQAVVAGPSKNITGIVKETPGIAWPIGTWVVEDNTVIITEQTVIKGDQSKAYFGAKVIVKGSHVNGVFVANEFEIRTDDDPTFAGR